MTTPGQYMQTPHLHTEDVSFRSPILSIHSFNLLFLFRLDLSEPLTTQQHLAKELTFSPTTIQRFTCRQVSSGTWTRKFFLLPVNRARSSTVTSSRSHWLGSTSCISAVSRRTTLAKYRATSLRAAWMLRRTAESPAIQTQRSGWIGMVALLEVIMI